MFKTIGNAFQGINSIAEGARKKRDGRKLIALAEAAERNFEQMDFVNNAGQIKVSGEATQKALENINLNASQAFSQAADAGIRGIGMIGKIQQNVNNAAQAEADRLAEREFAVQKARAAEQSQIQAEQQRISENNRNRSDAQLERGQALRSQGSAEIGQGASQVGGSLDKGLSGGKGKLADFAKLGGTIAGTAVGGPIGGQIGGQIGETIAGGGATQVEGSSQKTIPSIANTPINPVGKFNFRDIYGITNLPEWQ